MLSVCIPTNAVLTTGNTGLETHVLTSSTGSGAVNTHWHMAPRGRLRDRGSASRAFTGNVTSPGDKNIPIPFRGTSDAGTASSTLALTGAGVLTTAIQLVGSATLVLTSSSGLTTSIQLSGQSSLAITTSSDLTVGGAAAALAGSSTLALAVAGDLTTGIQLSGGSTLALTSNAGLTTNIQLVGDSTLVLTGAADLTAPSSSSSVEFIVTFRRHRR